MQPDPIAGYERMVTDHMFIVAQTKARLSSAFDSAEKVPVVPARGLISPTTRKDAQRCSGIDATNLAPFVRGNNSMTSCISH